jgi:hypothetical protein
VIFFPFAIGSLLQTRCHAQFDDDALVVVLFEPLANLRPQRRMRLLVPSALLTSSINGRHERGSTTTSKSATTLRTGDAMRLRSTTLLPTLKPPWANEFFL